MKIRLLERNGLRLKQVSSFCLKLDKQMSLNPLAAGDLLKNINYIEEETCDREWSKISPLKHKSYKIF